MTCICIASVAYAALKIVIFFINLYFLAVQDSVSQYVFVAAVWPIKPRQEQTINVCKFVLKVGIGFLYIMYL